MAQDTPSRKLEQYIVRFPDGMRDRLKEEAAKNNRSMNAEIIARLEASFHYDEFMPKYVLDHERLERGYYEAVKALEARDQPAKLATSITITNDLAAAIEKSAVKMGRTVEGQALYTLQSAYMPLTPKTGSTT